MPCNGEHFPKRAMPRAFVLLFLFGLLSFVSPCLGQAPATPLPESEVRNISALLEGQRLIHGLPAVAAVVIRGDKIVARGVAGLRRLGGAEPARLDDRWHLGSCTKAITATMIGVLVEQGKLSWDLTLAEAFPDLANSMRPEYREVTVEMLLSNRGGITSEWDVPGLWDVLWKREGTPVEERRKMTEEMLAQPPKVAPGEYFYANCGFGIAGHIAETITGTPWEQLVRELVFEPLGMGSAGFEVPWDRVPPTDPWPHKADGTVVTPGPFADNPPSIGPAGTVHASLDDWATFIMEHLRGAQGKNGLLLKADTYRRLHTARPFEKGTGDMRSVGRSCIGPGPKERAVAPRAGVSITRGPTIPGSFSYGSLQNGISRYL
jgi:CubicO group peptidase (beta-lactamase class C family)